MMGRIITEEILKSKACDKIKAVITDERISGNYTKVEKIEDIIADTERLIAIIHEVNDESNF